MKYFSKFVLFLFLILTLGFTEKLPRILIIGDSISLGYTPFVKEELSGKADVFHNIGNAEHTGTGLLKIDEWIGTEEWDIIQFNWGLWDLAYRHEDSKTQGKRDKINGTITFSPDEYKSNLDSLVSRIKQLSKAKLLFVTTSYVPEGEAGRYVNDAIIFNNVAVEVMEKYNVPVNDIYAFSKEVHMKHATGNDNVHYTKDGYKILAKKIVEGLSTLDKRLISK